MVHKARFAVVALLGLAAALYFWLFSRYPDLNAKAMLADAGNIEDALTVWPLFMIQASDSWWLRVALGTINWCYANMKGMTFGVFFGAVCLTLLSYIRLKAQHGRFANTVYGFAFGAPLGVCVNCAAPIFKGMMRSKRVELALAAMLSSPSMNMVVLTMVFSLFPWHLAVLKVAVALIAIFVMVPLMGRAFPSPAAPALPDSLPNDQTSHPPANDLNLWHAILQAVRDLLKSYGYMIVHTVPLMFLAGFLGSLISQSVPLDLFLADYNSFVAILVAAIGVMLPVPIAVDVILANALYSQGMDIRLVTILLCSLGLYSIYSYLVTWQSTTWRHAMTIAVVVFLLSLSAGALAPVLHQHFYVDANYTFFAEQRRLARDADMISGEAPQNSLTEKLRGGNANREMEQLPIDLDGVKVYRVAFQRQTSAASSRFTKFEGPELGLNHGFVYGIRDYPDPLWIGRGTAAGDIDGDGFPEVVFGTHQGIALYQNEGGYFWEIDTNFAWLKRLNVYAVALLDFDSDGDLDLFFTTYQKGNYLVPNHHGKLAFEAAIAVPNNGGILTVSPAFADFDNNGYLDVVNGNMALGIVTGYYDYGKGRQNSLTLNFGGSFKEMELPGFSGETMATLVADLNGDQRLDILFNNDFLVPDDVLLGGANLSFATAKPGPGFLEKTPHFSMSADTGDFNNDGHIDLLLLGTIDRAPFVGREAIDGVAPSAYAKDKGSESLCLGIKDQSMRDNCLVNRRTNHLIPFYRKQNLSVERCQALDSDIAVQDCLLSTMWMLITSEPGAFACEKQFADDPDLLFTCKTLAQRGARFERDAFPDAIPQENGNFILVGKGSGQFTDLNSLEEGAFRHPGGWTWAGRFIDLDGDGFQDVFNAEGSVRHGDYGFNTYMHNEGGKRFVLKPFSSNLVDDFNLFSFVGVDFDLDGDVDIIGNSSEGPPQIYVNGSAPSSAYLHVSLIDHQTNRQAIGARIKVVSKEKTQLREIKASGGYQSSDVAIAYFGLGAEDEILSIEVRWPDHTDTVIAGPLSVGFHYIIDRQASVTAH